MAVEAPISIVDENGVTRLEGTATFPDGFDASGITTPDVTTGDSEPIVITTGDAAAAAGNTGDITIATGTVEDGVGGGNAGNIVIRAGTADLGAGEGGNVYLQPGDGDTQGQVVLQSENGNTGLTVDDSGVAIITPGNLNIEPQGAVLIDPVGIITIGAGVLLVTVATGVPTTYTTPLQYDDTAVTGGLYAWDGAAYQKVGNVVA